MSIRTSVSKIAALLTGLLGAVVILGWYFNLPFLIQMHPSFVPMQYNTALCFLLLGLSLSALNFSKKQAVLPLAFISLLIALLTLYEYYAMVNLGIDELFIEHYIFVNTPFPGRMSLNTAVCFVISSIALIAAGINKKQFKYFITVLGSAALSAGVFSLVGYITKYEFVYTWSHYSQMAVHTSTGFSFIGISILAYTLPRPKEEIARQFWLLYTAASFIFLFCILFILLMRNAETLDNKQLIASEVENISTRIQDDLNDTFNTLNRMRKRLSISEEMFTDVWSVDAESYLNDETTLNSIVLIDADMTVRGYLKKNEDGIAEQIKANSEINEIIAQLNLTPAQQTDLPDALLIKKAHGLSFLLFPIFKDNNINGWLLGAISFQHSLLPYALQAREQGYAFELRETDGSILFRSGNFSETKTELFQEKNIQLGNNQWIIHFQDTPDFYKIHTSYMQLVISISTGILLALLTWVILQYFRMQEQRRLVSRLYSRQSSALNVMIDGLVVITGKGIIQEVNRAALSMFGYERPELVGKNVKCMMPEPYQTEHDGYLQKYKETGEQHVIGKGRILTGKRKDGSVFPINLQVTEGIDDGEKFYTGVIADLTEKLSIESKLAQKDAMLNAAVHGSSAGFAIEDNSGKYIEVNDALCKWLGYSREEIIGKTALDLVPDEEKNKAIEIHRKLSSGEENAVHIRKMYQRKNGDTVWGLLSATAVKNKDGGVIFVVKHIIDIQNEVELAVELQEAQDFQKLITEKNPDLIFVKDENFKIVFANPAFLDLYPEISRKDIIGTTTYEDVSSEEIESFFEQDKIAFSEGYSEIVERLSFPDGTTRVVSTTKTRFENVNGKPFILGVSKDVTEREKLIEKLEKSNSDLDQFAYVASHDLKAPLNAIQKIIKWLEEDCIDILPEASKEHFDLLKARAQRMSQLLNDLLQYSRIGRYDYSKDKIKLKSMVKDIFNLLEVSESFAYKVDDVELAVPKIPFEIILRNLISNAVKHHDKDKGLIVIECLLSDNLYTIKVIDDGPGILPELHEKAFEMFQTLKSRDQIEGSGMGLPTVKRIIEHYHGNIELISDGKNGTIINIYWPKNK